MDLRKEILREHSKKQCMLIADHVNSSQSEFDKLFELFVNDESIVMQRAGWPALYAVRADPALMEKHLSRLINFLKQENLHQGCRRNGFAILDSVIVPDELHGELLDLCFHCFESHEESIAAKSNILSILTKLVKVYPEIAEEIKLLIQYQPQPLPAALRSRVRAFEKLCKKKR